MKRPPRVGSTWYFANLKRAYVVMHGGKGNKVYLQGIEDPEDTPVATWDGESLLVDCIQITRREFPE